VGLVVIEFQKIGTVLVGVVSFRTVNTRRSRPWMAKPGKAQKNVAPDGVAANLATARAELLLEGLPAGRQGVEVAENDRVIKAGAKPMIHYSNGRPCLYMQLGPDTVDVPDSSGIDGDEVVSELRRRGRVVLTPVVKLYAREKEMEERLSHFFSCPPDIEAEINALDKAKEDTRAETIEDVILKVIEMEKCAGEGEDLEARLARGIRLDLERLIAK